jgi:hypothetical protein
MEKDSTVRLTFPHICVIGLIIAMMSDTVAGSLARAVLVAPLVYTGIISIEAGENFAMPYTDSREAWLHRQAGDPCRPDYTITREWRQPSWCR